MYPNAAALKSAARAAIVEIQRQGYTLDAQQAKLLEEEVEGALLRAFASHVANVVIELELNAPFNSVQTIIDRVGSHYLSFENHAR
jgi:hypothetical protein